MMMTLAVKMMVMAVMTMTVVMMTVAVVMTMVAMLLVVVVMMVTVGSRGAGCRSPVGGQDMVQLARDIVCCPLGPQGPGSAGWRALGQARGRRHRGEVLHKDTQIPD